MFITSRFLIIHKFDVKSSQRKRENQGISIDLEDALITDYPEYSRFTVGVSRNSYTIDFSSDKEKAEFLKIIQDARPQSKINTSQSKH